MSVNGKRVVTDRTAKSSPVSRKELDWIKSRRAQPVAVPECTLGSADSSNTRWLAEQRRAAREHYVETRLRRVDGQALESFSRANVNGHAKHEFNQSRDRERER